MKLVVRVVATALLVASLVACTSAPAPTGTPAPSGSTEASSEPSASPSAAPAPSLQPAGTAADNLAFFDSVNETLLASNPMPGGRAIIDNLVAAGFDKTLMQVTPDLTAIGLDADSVQFSVRYGAECLVGQASPSGYIGTVGPAVSQTACLLGVTRTIDW